MLWQLFTGGKNIRTELPWSADPDKSFEGSVNYPKREISKPDDDSQFMVLGSAV